MAGLVRSREQVLLIPATAAEQALVREGEASGQLVLQEGYYLVANGAIVLPASTSETRARELVGVFERAARRHGAAVERRGLFRLVPGRRAKSKED
jgi:hypothetical protein